MVEEVVGEELKIKGIGMFHDYSCFEMEFLYKFHKKLTQRENIEIRFQYISPPINHGALLWSDIHTHIQGVFFSLALP